MTTVEIEKTLEDSRARRLKSATPGAHERLDKSIMMQKPFDSRERYGLFVQMQYQFHREIDALYDAPVLDKLLPDLKGRRRFGLIERDLADLGMKSPATDASPVFEQATDMDLPTALGWLYVAEGSNLGAAFLLKEAAKLGLSETFGARHLAAAPEGRGLHWKTFTAALDALQLTEPEETRVIDGARAAFLRVCRNSLKICSSDEQPAKFLLKVVLVREDGGPPASQKPALSDSQPAESIWRRSSDNDARNLFQYWLFDGRSGDDRSGDTTFADNDFSDSSCSTIRALDPVCGIGRHPGRLRARQKT